MKLNIILLSMLAVISPQISHAISLGSISDAISNNTTQSSSVIQPNKTTPQEDRKYKKVQKTKIESKAPPQTESHLPNPALFIEDAAMTGYIHSQLLLKKNIPNVSVTTENAIVSLSGTVDTQEQADTLVKTASAVKGVKFVNTEHLVIRKKN